MQHRNGPSGNWNILGDGHVGVSVSSTVGGQSSVHMSVIHTSIENCFVVQTVMEKPLSEGLSEET